MESLEYVGLLIYSKEEGKSIKLKTGSENETNRENPGSYLYQERNFLHFDLVRLFFLHFFLNCLNGIINSFFAKMVHYCIVNILIFKYVCTNACEDNNSFFTRQGLIFNQVFQ